VYLGENDNGMDGIWDTLLTTGTELYKGQQASQAARAQRKLLRQQQALLAQQQALEVTRAQNARALTPPPGIMGRLGLPSWALPLGVALLAKKLIF